MTPDDAVALISAHADGERAKGAKADHKSNRVHLGVPNPVLNDLTTSWRQSLDDVVRRRKSTRLNSSHPSRSRMPSSA